MTFLNITDPYNMETTPEPESLPPLTPQVIPRVAESPAESFYRTSYDDAPGLEALSAAATSNFDYMRPVCTPG